MLNKFGSKNKTSTKRTSGSQNSVTSVQEEDERVTGHEDGKKNTFLKVKLLKVIHSVNDKV